MLTSPNFLRPGVVGGFILSPPELSLPCAFTANSTWITITPPGSWAPSVGAECAFTIGDAYSGMPLIVGTCFNWRGPWKSGTSYAVGDAMVWFDIYSVLHTYLCTTAWGGGSSVDYTKFRIISFRGAFAASTAYTAGDVVNALDPNGNMQSWVAPTSFTSGATFNYLDWVQALPTNTVLYVVGVESGEIQVSTSPLGQPITFMTGAWFEAPDGTPNLTVQIASEDFGPGTGLTPSISIGALFAQGTLYQPATAPVLTAAPASQYSYLAYNSTAGFYWTTNPAGTAAGDAVVGWVVTNSTDLVAASNQDIRITAGGSTSSSGGGVSYSGVSGVGAGSPGGAAAFGGMETMTPDVSWNLTPDGSKGLGHYYTIVANAVHVKPAVNVTGGSMVLVVVYQPASGSGQVVTFDAAYKGISEVLPVDTKVGTHTSILFQVQSDLSLMRVWAETGVLSA